MMPDIDIVCAKSLEENLGIRNHARYRSLPIMAEEPFSNRGRMGHVKWIKIIRLRGVLIVRNRASANSRSGRPGQQRRSRLVVPFKR